MIAAVPMRREGMVAAKLPWGMGWTIHPSWDIEGHREV